jgi:hypothetical protein
MGGIPYELVDPTFDRVQDYLDGEIEEASDPAQRRLVGDRVKRARRSLADTAPVIPEDESDPTEELTGPPEDGSYHTQDGTPDGPPLAGDTDDEPAKPARRGGRRTPAKAAPDPADANGGTEDTPPARRSGKRRTPAESAARTAVKAETDDKPVRATRTAAARKGGKRTPADTKSSGFANEPPF